MATITRGKHKGKTCELSQWANDWVSVTVEGVPVIMNPTSLQFTEKEMYEILTQYPESTGFFHKRYQPGPGLVSRKLVRKDLK